MKNAEEDIYLKVITEIFAIQDYTHPLLLSSCINLARIYQKRGDHEATVAFYRRILQRIEPEQQNELLLVCAYESMVWAHRFLKNPVAAAYYSKKLARITRRKLVRIH